MVKSLKQDGADVDAFDDEALRKSAQNGNSEIVKILLKTKRANVWALDYEALQLAAKNGHLQTVKMLVRNYSD